MRNFAADVSSGFDLAEADSNVSSNAWKSFHGVNLIGPVLTPTGTRFFPVSSRVRLLNTHLKKKKEMGDVQKNFIRVFFEGFVYWNWELVNVNKFANFCGFLGLNFPCVVAMESLIFDVMRFNSIVSLVWGIVDINFSSFIGLGLGFGLEFLQVLQVCLSSATWQDNCKRKQLCKWNVYSSFSCLARPGWVQHTRLSFFVRAKESLISKYPFLVACSFSCSLIKTLFFLPFFFLLSKQTNINPHLHFVYIAT